MTEEQKRKMAEGRERAKAEKLAAMAAAQAAETTAPPAKPATEEVASEIGNLKALVAQLQAQLASQRPQIVQIAADTEKVLLRFQAEVAEDNLATFGAGGIYGQVTGKTGTVIVPKAEWSRFYDEQTKYLLKERILIVLSGLSEDEMELYGLNYREGETLDQKAFTKLLDMGRDLLAIYPRLCTSHKAMVAKRFLEGYEQGHPTTRDRDLVLALNELSKEPYKSSTNLSEIELRKKGLFAPIIQRLNNEDTAGA